MTFLLMPRAASTPSPPSVGIFWLVSGALVVDRAPLDAAEPYGDCLTHAAGHHERWQQWQALGARGLEAGGLPVAIASTEYDEWPRGRVVYETPAGRFVLYADRRLQKRPVLEILKVAFGLSEADVVVRSDSHYR